MKIILSLLIMGLFSVGTVSSFEQDTVIVQIEPVKYSESQIQDYERILEIDSLQTELQNEKDSLLNGIECHAANGIERATNL